MPRAFAVALFISVIASAVAVPSVVADDAFDVRAREHRIVLTDHLRRTAKRLTSGTAYPLVEDTTGRWRTGTASDWRSGFWPTSVWTQYAATLDRNWRAHAERFMPGLAGQASRTDTHDLGFSVFLPFGEQYRLTGDLAARSTILQAASSLATRYNSAVGATRSWNTTNGRFRVIIDNLMNLELLFWGARNGGDPNWKSMAHQHALTSLREHVRPDGSVHHIVDFDPVSGATIARWTHQPTNAQSTWSRGQAWAVHGLTSAYRETADVALLEGARRTADWYLTHLPADGVPLWDFGAPMGDPPDSSASAIAAAGLMELARIDPDPESAARWRASAEQLFENLTTSPYFDRAGTSEASVLRSTQSKPAGSVNVGVPYGEYYLAQAAERHRLLASTEPVMPLAAAVSSSGTAHAAIDGSPETSWSGAANTTLRLDLGEIRRVRAVSLTFAGAQQKTALFRISAGVSTSALPIVLNAASSGNAASEETFDITDVDARYVRITAVGSTDHSGIEIAEARIR